jgi:hypothetical protein
MSSVSIWSNAPKSVRQAVPQESTSAALKDSQRTFIIDDCSQKKKGDQKTSEQRIFPEVIPAGQKCKHGKWQPEAVETIRAKQWTCYECTFVCSKCRLNSIGICDSYDCS